MDGGAHGNSPRILNQISKISQWTSSGGGYDLKNQRSSLLWVASLHPAVTVVPGHEFGISRNIHDGNIYQNHGCCGNIPKSGNEEPNAFMDPPFWVNRDKKQKKDDDETHNSQEEGERRMYRGIKVNDPGNLSAPPSPNSRYSDPIYSPPTHTTLTTLLSTQRKNYSLVGDLLTEWLSNSLD